MGDDGSFDDEGPVEVPYQEPNDAERQYWAQQAARSEQITVDAAWLRQSLEWIQSHVSNLYGSEIADGTWAGYATELSGVAGHAQQAQDGLEDGVYARNAFHSVAYWAAHAAGLASQAEVGDRQAASGTVGDAIVNALAALHGV